MSKTNKQVCKNSSKKNLQGRNFRWVVPQLDLAVWGRKEQFKTQVLDRLRSSKTARKGIEYYSIAVESHADGHPHLDLLVTFKKQVRMGFDELDFLVSKHGDLTRYRTLNHAILHYGSKEDRPLTNCSSFERILDVRAIQEHPYEFLQAEMLAAPFTFNLADFCAQRDFFKEVRNYAAIQAKMRKHQQSVCNLALRAKKGFRAITPELIRARLSPSELIEFQSWPGYQTIVDILNEACHCGGHRPFKAKHLLLVGAPDIGKTSLINKIREFCSVYPMGVSKWFPRYLSGVYQFIAWNEFRLTLMPYPQLLQFLEGSPMDIEYKGGSCLKTDNPLVLMTSNLTLRDHLWEKFKSYDMGVVLKAALKNLPARITEVIVPQNRTLFLLQKLIVAAQ